MKLKLAVLKHESYLFEITIILCASENALWLCVSSNYLHQYMNFTNLSFEWFHPNMNSFYMLFQKLEKEYHHHPLLTHENYTFEITLMLCASENALCVNVSSNDLEEHITRVHSEAHNMMIMSNVCEVQVLINFTDDDASFSNF